MLYYNKIIINFSKPHIQQKPNVPMEMHTGTTWSLKQLELKRTVKIGPKHTTQRATKQRSDSYYTRCDSFRSSQQFSTCLASTIQCWCYGLMAYSSATTIHSNCLVLRPSHLFVSVSAPRLTLQYRLHAVFIFCIFVLFCIPEHSLNELLEDRRHELIYSLRPRRHDLTLTGGSHRLSDCNFIVRLLFKDSYWSLVTTTCNLILVKLRPDSLFNKIILYCIVLYSHTTAAAGMPVLTVHQWVCLKRSYSLWVMLSLES